MHKEITANRRVNRRNFACYVILAFIIAASGGVYIYKNYTSFRSCFTTGFTEKNITIAGVSPLSIPQFTVCGTIYKNEDIAASMAKDLSACAEQHDKTTKTPLNKILIKNFSTRDVKNAYLDIIIGNSCIEYLQKFISDNNVDFKFSLFLTNKDKHSSNYYIDHDLNYSSLRNSNAVKNNFKTQFINIMKPNDAKEIHIPHDVCFFVNLLAHLNLFYKESFDIKKILNQPIQIIIVENNGKDKALSTTFSQILSIKYKITPDKPDEITYVADIAPI